MVVWEHRGKHAQRGPCTFLGSVEDFLTRFSTAPYELS